MRKCVSISTVQIAGQGGSSGSAVLFAVADDGTIWTARTKGSDGMVDEWHQVTSLPDKVQKDPLEGLGTITPHAM